MTKKEIIAELRSNYALFGDLITSLNEDDFSYSPEGKWNAGQQLDHLIRAVSPLSIGLRLPKFLIRALYGKANRPSKSFDELVKKYKSKLEGGGRARGRFIPGKIQFYNKKKNIKGLLAKIEQLVKNIDSYSERQLDTFILPHPLLGKVTLREMMYFTIYHAEHHRKQTISNAGK